MNPFIFLVIAIILACSDIALSNNIFPSIAIVKSILHLFLYNSVLMIFYNYLNKFFIGFFFYLVYSSFSNEPLGPACLGIVLATIYNKNFKRANRMLNTDLGLGNNFLHQLSFISIFYFGKYISTGFILKDFNLITVLQDIFSYIIIFLLISVIR
jgi:hypothetical protein